MRTSYTLQNTEVSVAATKDVCICNKEQHHLILMIDTLLVKTMKHKMCFKLSKDDDRLMMVWSHISYVTNCMMYHFTWADQRTKQGYKWNVFMEREIELKCIPGKLCSWLVDKPLIQSVAIPTHNALSQSLTRFHIQSVTWI